MGSYAPFGYAPHAGDALCLVGLWKRGMGRPTWRSALALGLLHGSVTVVAKPLFRLVHPRPFDLPQGIVWIADELVDHAAYALTVARTYAGLTGAAEEG